VSVPLQVAPQVVPALSQLVREPWAAPVTGEHLPTLPGTSHAAHWSVQAESQQTPSVQKLLRQSLFAAHVWPRGTKSSALERTPPLPYPPTMSTLPEARSVEVCPARAVVIESVAANVLDPPKSSALER
jgi:hypothetical protein